MTKIYVNGRFLGRTMTGVERFAFMVLDRVHARIVSGAEPARWTLLLPPGVEKPAQWTGFAAKNVGSRGGHVWEQATLPGAARDGVLVNLCNSGPVLPRRSLTIIHDALVYDMPGNFSRPYRLLHQSLGRLLSRRSHLGTVSMFSRDRLSAVLKVPADAIPVIPNAADHIDAIAPDDKVLNALDVERGRYLLFVGSFAPNKNLPRALEAFARIRRPEDRLVLVGAAVRSFAQNGLGDVPPEGVVLPGRISDAALMSLYRSARALVFPSLYEGFGIPPLEAMRFGRPVIAGDIPPVREVCGDAALYCDPKSVEAIATAMQTMLRDDAVHADLAGKVSARSRQFSWDASADALLRALKAI